VPKYYYHCHNCHGDFYVYHMMSEQQELCTICDAPDISKLLTKPLHVIKKSNSKKTGDITKKYIDDNKKILEDMKKKATSAAHSEKNES